VPPSNPECAGCPLNSCCEGLDYEKNRIISCVKTKLDHTAKAKDLYISDLFRKNLAYAKKMKPDHIFILSAKYGLLGLDDRIAPYEKTLNRCQFPRERLGRLE
jgi:hypothetical protein